MNRIWTIAGAMFLLSLAGCSRNAEHAGTLFVSGRIEGNTVDISPKFPGRVAEIPVREGDSVQAGQVVARISSPQEEAQLEAQKANVINAAHRLDEAQAAAPARVQVAEANLAVAKADLVRYEAELKQAQTDAKRYPPLVLTGASAAQTADTYQTKLRIALASVDASHKQVVAADAAVQQAKAQMEQIGTAKASLAASRAELRRVEANLNDLAITAPIGGTILLRSVEPGRIVDAGQTIFTMVDLRKLYLRGYVPDRDIGKVKVGQKAQVWLDSNPKEPIAAEVIRIYPQSIFTPENVYFEDARVKQVVEVELGLLGAYGYAKPGMPADGRIQIETP
jgi:HlyD family secretion protein